MPIPPPENRDGGNRHIAVTTKENLILETMKLTAYCFFTVAFARQSPPVAKTEVTEVGEFRYV